VDRALGLSIDNLISADVVTADGRFLTASERENEDLFWGLRGGDGNFGIVTSLEFGLSEVDQVFAGPIFYNLDDAATVFRMFDEFIRDAPEELGGFPRFQIATAAAVHPGGPARRPSVPRRGALGGGLSTRPRRCCSRSETSRRSSPTEAVRCRTRRRTAPSTSSIRRASARTGREPSSRTVRTLRSAPRRRGGVARRAGPAVTPCAVAETDPHAFSARRGVARRRTGRGGPPQPTVTAEPSSYGQILFDRRGFVLYGFTQDPRGRSPCRGACARAWPPYIVASRPRADSGVAPRRLGTTRRADGSLQATYAGRPLYYYVGDRKPGQILCQNVFEYRGYWRVIHPSGALVSRS
jgi:predicted lipoprotein with Yx(FWY)xxD motif